MLTILFYVYVIGMIAVTIAGTIFVAIDGDDYAFLFWLIVLMGSIIWPVLLPLFLIDELC